MAGALARIYSRSARRYVVLFVVVLVLVILGYTGASVVIFARFFDMPWEDTRLFLIVGESGPLIGLAISAAISARREPGITEWLSGGPKTEAKAVEAWNGLAGLPARLVVRSMIIIGAITGPMLTVALGQGSLDAAALAWLMFGMIVLNLGCASFALILLDIFLRPVRTAIDRALPRDFEPPHLRMNMNRRINAELFLLIFAPALLTTGLLTPVGGGATAYAESIVVAGVVTSAFAVLIGQVLVERVSGPVRDLLEGTRAITAGDLGARVPLASTDEHLVLTDSFNRMAAGLRERQALHTAMGTFIDPTIAERVMTEGASLGGEAVEVTVMFIDIVGFTARAENQAPEEVVADLNAFFDLVIPVVAEHGGHANKLLGDGLMAVFGVPLALPDHAERALAAAREIERRIVEAGDDLRVGIGLNSGRVVAGTMGCGSKLDYTIVGDVVNVAARVEAHTRVTGDTILLTDATNARLADIDPLVWRGAHALKGRTGHVGLWAVGTPHEPDTARDIVYGRFVAGIAAGNDKRPNPG